MKKDYTETGFNRAILFTGISYPLKEGNAIGKVCWILILLLCLHVPKANATQFEWTGLAGDSLWENPANWQMIGGSLAVYPKGLDSIYFDNGGIVRLRSTYNNIIVGWQNINYQDNYSSCRQLSVINGTTVNLYVGALQISQQYGTMYINNGSLTNDGNIYITNLAADSLSATINNATISCASSANNNSIAINGNVNISNSNLYAASMVSFGTPVGAATAHINITGSVIKTTEMEASGDNAMYNISNGELQLGAFFTSTYPFFSIDSSFAAGCTNTVLRYLNTPLNCASNNKTCTFSLPDKDLTWNGDIVFEQTDPDAVLYLNDYQHTITINGNLLMSGGNLMRASHLSITGDLRNTGGAGIPDPSSCNYSFFAGSFSYKVKVGSDSVLTAYKSNPATYRVSFIGSGTSYLQWPTPFSAGALQINKTGCGRLVADTTPIFAQGGVEVSSGTLELQGNDHYLYQLITDNSVIVDSGAAIVMHNTGNGTCNMAAAGNILDYNNVLDTTNCKGIYVTGISGISSYTSTNNTNNYNGWGTISAPTIRMQDSAAAHWHRLNYNNTSKTYTLAGNLTIPVLDAGYATFILGAYDLRIKDSIINFLNNISYIVTGDTGSLIIEGIGTGGKNNVLFPVSSHNNNFENNYVVLSNNGVIDNFHVRVADTMRADGAFGMPITSGVVNKTWMIDEDVAGGSNATVALQWNFSGGSSNNELAGFERTDCYISHYTNGSWDMGTAQNATGTNPFSISRSNITSFSPFAVVATGAPLAITIKDFEASIDGGSKVLLSWDIAEEADIEAYTIERSYDGKSFAAIGHVVATSQQKYHFVDNGPLSGPDFYRLKISRKNNAVDYSLTREVLIKEVNATKVFPVPASDYITVQVNDIALLNTPALLTDMQGKVMCTYTLTKNIIQLDISKLSDGSYRLQLSDGSSFVVIKKTGL